MNTKKELKNNHYSESFPAGMTVGELKAVLDRFKDSEVVMVANFNSNETSLDEVTGCARNGQAIQLHVGYPNA